MKHFSNLPTFIYSFIAIAINFSGCSLPTYYPSSVHAPQLSEKRQFTGSAGFGENIEIKAAYAATNHLGVIIDYSSSSSETGTDPLAGVFSYTENEQHQQKIFHAGAGYFNANKRFVYEAFAGFAIGNADHSYRIYAIETSGFDLDWKMKRVFLCADAGVKFQNFAAGLACRVNYSMFDPLYSGFDVPGNSVYYSSKNKAYNKNLDILNFEQGIFVRGGIKNVQLNLELTLSTKEEHKWFLNSGGALQIGLLFNLYRKESNKPSKG